MAPSTNQEDGRRAQYVPVNTNIAFGKTANRLRRKYGNDGLLTWLLVLAAAKRSREQGVFIYTSEPEGWQLIGLSPAPFSLDAFFAFTGRGGGTRMVRSGSVRRITLVAWESWNGEWKKQQGSERMSSKRAQNARTNGAHSAHDARTEVELEYEYEVKGLRKIETPDGVLAFRYPTEDVA